MTARKAVEGQEWVRAFDQRIMFLDLEAVINNAFDFIHHAFGSDHLSIAVRGKAKKDLLIAGARPDIVGLPIGSKWPMGKLTASGKAVTQKTRYRHDLRLNAGSSVANKALLASGIRSVLHVPLTARGRLVGILNYGMATPDGVSIMQRQSLELIAPRLATAIEHALVLKTITSDRLLFQNILECLNDALLVADAQNLKVIRCNPAVRHVFGYPEEEISGRKLSFLFASPAAYERTKSQQSAVLDRQSVFRTEGKFLRKDGIAFTGELTMTRASDASSPVPLLVSVIRDVDKERRIEEELRTSHERFELSQEVARVGTWDWNLQSKTVQSSTSFFRLLGREPSTKPLSWEDWLAFVHPDDRDGVSIEEARAHATGREPFGKEFRVVWPDGSVHWLAARGRMMKGSGRKSRRFIGVNIDIDKQKMLERRAREYEQRLLALLDAIQEGIVLLDSRLKVVECNATMSTWAGRKVIGLSCHTVICGSRRQCTDCPGALSLEEGKLHSRVMKSSLPGLPKDAWLCVYSYPVRDADGKVDGVVEYIQDITERRNLEQRVNHISGMERASMRRDIHDSLSQQLTAIAFLASNLKEDMPKDPAVALQDVSRIGALAQEAIEQSRHIARGLEPLSEAPDALPRALRDLAAFIRKSIKVSCRATCQQSVRLPDRETSTQLFMIAREAAVNAAKHSRATRILISLTQRTPQVRLVVRDNGIGMATDLKETDGFGLRTMWERANLIGALLRVRSSRGKGTEVECRWNLK